MLNPLHFSCFASYIFQFIENNNELHLGWT